MRKVIGIIIIMITIIIIIIIVIMIIIMMLIIVYIQLDNGNMIAYMIYNHGQFIGRYLSNHALK